MGDYGLAEVRSPPAELGQGSLGRLGLGTFTFVRKGEVRLGFLG
jgi:hypothetical protein